jgi:hypothetical protein
MNILQENDRALLIQFHKRHFETWIKLHYTTGKRKGLLIYPTDEDFGVRAWSHYSLERAQQYFEDITSGKLKIVPMSQQV